MRETVFSLAVHPRRPGTLWAGTREDGVVRSTDGGRTWQRAAVPIPSDIVAIVVDPAHPRVLYAAVDAGRTWVRTIAGLPLPSILGLTIDRRRPAILYAGGLDPNGHGGVYRSSNGGRTWTDVTGAMTTTWIAALALTPSGRVLYAGTTAYGRETGGGVFVARVR